MHQVVKDGGRHGDVAEVLAPVLYDPVGGHDDAALWLVALVLQRLQQFAAGIAGTAGQEQIVEYQHVRVEQRAHLLPLLSGVSEGVLSERAISLQDLQVAHVELLQRGLVSHRLGDMALAGAGLADDECVVSLGDEVEGVQLEAGHAHDAVMGQYVPIGGVELRFV